MADVRRIVHAWWPNDGDAELACALIEEPLTEDKLAGIIALAEILIDDLGERDLARFERLFAEGHLADWNSCDWFCVKVLGPMLQRAEDPLPLATAIAEWRTADSLWQRRAAAVAFVKLVPRPEEHFRGLTELALEVCSANARGTERFVQTSVGWLLRELARTQPEAVEDWVAREGELLSAEARKMLAGQRRRR
jgi:3-methyladenine DNA glycosylase AlkD